MRKSTVIVSKILDDYFVPYESPFGICKDIAVLCPQQCGEVIQNELVEVHLRDFCKHTCVVCPFGCGEQVRKRRFVVD